MKRVLCKYEKDFPWVEYME